jgi:hypothetical protein
MAPLTVDRHSCCAGVADFAGVCQNLQSYLVDVLESQRRIGDS